MISVITQSRSRAARHSTPILSLDSATTLNHNLFRLTPLSGLPCLSGTSIQNPPHFDELSCCSLCSEVCGSCRNRRPQKRDGLSKVGGLFSIPMTSVYFPPAVA